MRRFSLRDVAFVVGLAVVSSTPALAGGIGTSSGIPARLEMTDDGPVFVTPEGRTLYVNPADDSTPGKSTCTNVVVRDMVDPTAGIGKYPLPGHTFLRSCIERWPAFMASANAQPINEWGIIARPEGRQWTYRNRPVYMSAKDTKAGERNGVMSAEVSRRGWRLAAPPLDFPPGLQFTRIDDELVLATANGRPVYTPRSGKRVLQAGLTATEVFQPVSAPLLAKVGGDWSAVSAGPGRLQYAYHGKPLYAAPDSMSNAEIAEMAAWETVVFRKLAGTPRDIGKQFTMMGEVYTDKSGHTLYTFSCTSPGCDDPGGPAAYRSAICGDAQECSRRWRPYVAVAGARPVGDWSIVDVPDPIFRDGSGPTYTPDLPRVKGWAYRGRPVFTYHEDKEPGDIWGNQIRWFAMSSFNAVQVPGRGILE